MEWLAPLRGLRFISHEQTWHPDVLTVTGSGAT